MKYRHVTPRISVPLLLVLFATGCSVGGGADSGIGPLVDHTRASWQVVDLDTGMAAPLATAPDLNDAALRDRHMLFRLVLPAEVIVGQAAGSFARQDDEVLRSIERPAYYLAVFETTRAQWQHLAGSAPWTSSAVAALEGSGTNGPGNSDLPATGLGLAQVQSALMGWNRERSGQLGIPSAEMWEGATRAGTTSTFPWGESRARNIVNTWAVTWESGVTGLQSVGSRAANPLGFYDTVGNAWELTADGMARGGSWTDCLALARPANHRDVPADGWATVGVRLTWHP